MTARARAVGNAGPGTESPEPETPARVLVLVGPTASGKTDVALLLAGLLKGEIVSADSRQVFKGMDIGTAKPSREERSAVQHHFVDDLLPDREFNAGDYGVRGREVIGDIFRRGKVPIVAGGSGLYVQALIDGFFEGVPPDPEVRSGLYRRLSEEGPQALLSELKDVDPLSASRMLPSNTSRIVRALEVYRLTGKPISELQKSRIDIPFRPVMAGLAWDRRILYDRINRRVERMLDQGLVEEVRALRSHGFGTRLSVLRTTGYKEVSEYLDGRLGIEEMVSLIKRNTRRYAKRQLTWFRHDSRIRWFEVREEGEYPRLASRIADFFRDAM